MMIDYQTKINELKLDLTHPKNKGINYIFVEGINDIKLFRKIFNNDKCKVEWIPGGKLKLEECVETLINTHPLIIGIRDADFLHLEEKKSYYKKNVFLTDHHDIEMTMLANDSCFRAILYEYSNIESYEFHEFKNNLLILLAPLSCLKWLNDIEKLELDFKCDFTYLINHDDLNFNLEEYIKRVKSKSPNAKDISDVIIINMTNELHKESLDLLQVVNGHDFLKALESHLKIKENNNKISSIVLESSLRMKYEFSHFTSTILYKDLSNWAISNNTVLFDEK